MTVQDASRPVPLRVRLPFATEAEFIERFGSNLSRSGLFIPTRALKPEGTLLRFELVLADGTRLLRGDAVVAKTQVDTGGARSGMTLRFLKLDAESEAFLEALLALRHGSSQPLPPSPTPPSPQRIEGRGEGAPAGPAASPPEPPPAPAPVTQAPEPPAPEEAPAAEAPEEPPPPAAPVQRAPDVPDELPPTREARERREGRRTALMEAPVPPVRRQEADPVLGVELGSAFTRAALFRQGSVELLTLDGTASAQLPSAVALRAGSRALVGGAALEVRAHAAGEVATGYKRLLGRRARSARMLELAAEALPPVVADTSGNAALMLEGRPVSPVELTARQLEAVAEAAARQLGQAVRRLVLAVPAHFTDAQRTALVEAARQAGLEVARLVNAPSAAALAFGHGRALARKRLLVYDLGAGTFDVSVVEVTGDDVDVVSTGGDNFLGGLDFDARVAYELRRRLEEAGLVPPAPHAPESWRLRAAAEEAKRALSHQEEVEVVLPGLAREGGGAAKDFRTRLSRARLEELTADLVERTLTVLQEVLQAAALSPQGLDEVLLLGGQAGSPHVRRRLEEALGRPVRADSDSAGLVARGAALLGHSLVRAAQGKAPIHLSEVLSTPVGLAERGGTVRRVFERNTRLPATKTLVLPARAGEPVALLLVQGEAPMAEDTELLGTLLLTPERAGEVEVHVTLSADALLALEVSLPGARRQAVALDARQPPAEALAQLLSHAPEGDAPPPPAGGLLGGLRRLFGRR